MDSKEFGLVAAQQLFKIDDIHYGFWEDGEKATLGTWKKAQEAHTQFLFNHIFEHLENKETSHMLDIGCGIGFTTKRLLDLGYNVADLVGCDGKDLYVWTRMSNYNKDDNDDSYEISLFGLTYKPLDNISFKVEMGTNGQGGDTDVMRLGLGYMF